MANVSSRNRNASAVLDSDIPVDAKALMPMFRVLFDWALDIADGLARDFNEEVDAVARVREFVHDHLAGSPATISPKDILAVVSLIISRIDHEHKARGDGDRDARPMRLPSAIEYGHEVPLLLV